MPRSPRAVEVPGESAAEAEQVQAAPQAAEPEASGLPDASDVDPTKIRRAVLTRQGWVCPAESPAPPSKE